MLGVLHWFHVAMDRNESSSSKQGDATSLSLNYGEFFDLLTYCWLLRKDSAPGSNFDMNNELCDFQKTNKFFQSFL
jgi:hypothetical protein